MKTQESPEIREIGAQVQNLFQKVGSGKFSWSEITETVEKITKMTKRLPELECATKDLEELLEKLAAIEVRNFPHPDAIDITHQEIPFDDK